MNSEPEYCCEICKKELKGKIAWVNCQFFNYHPYDECGGCSYMIGMSCLEKVKHYDKDLIEGYSTIDEWKKQIKN